MHVTIFYTAQLRTRLGVDSERVELPSGSSLSALIDCLRGRHAEQFTPLITDDSGAVQPSILVCVDDQQVAPHDSGPLPEGAQITFMSAISGG